MYKNACLFAVLCTLFFTGATVTAATLTWNGGDGGAWDTASNWLLDGAASTRTPANGDTINVSSGKAITGSRGFSNTILNLNGGNLEMNADDFTMYSGMTVNQSAGAFTLTKSSNSWLNIGESEGGSAAYNMTGGSLNAIQMLVVGRRGEGHMTVSGADTTVTAGTLTIGFFPQMSGNSDLTLNGGTTTVNGITYVSGGSHQAGTHAGTNSLNVAGGTLVTKGETHVGTYSSGLNSVSGAAVKTNLNVTAGTWNANGLVKVGIGDISADANTNTANVNISGGTVNFNQDVQVGVGKKAVAAITISDAGTANFNLLRIGLGAGVTASVNVAGGTANFKNVARVGDVTTGNMTLSGGNSTFSDDVYVGYQTGATGVMNIIGGTNSFTRQLIIGYDHGNGTLNLSGGTNTFANPLVIGWNSGVGTLNISGNVLTNSLIVGKDGGTGTVNITEDTTFTKQVFIGNGGTGTMKISSGNTVFNLAGTTLQIGANGTSGTLEISGTANVTFSGYDVHVGNGGSAVGNILQTGGTFTVNGWLNVGEGSKGTYDISAGTLNTNANFVVGRRSQGTVTISGTADVNSKDVIIGYFPERSGASLLHVKGGTLDGTRLFISNQDMNDSVGAITNASTMTLDGGTVHFTGNSYIGYTGMKRNGGIGILNVNAGAITFDSETSIGYGTKGDGTLNITGTGSATFKAAHIYGYGEGSVGKANISGGTLNAEGASYIGFNKGAGTLTVSGGTANLKGEARVGDGEGSVGTMNVSSGTAKFIGTGYIGLNKGTGTLNVSGGEARFSLRSYVGYGSGSSGTLNITGGTVYAGNFDFIVGDGNALGKFIVDGGTYNQHETGNFVITSTTAADADGSVGSQVILKSGTIDTTWLSLGQNGTTGGFCSFTMTGGNLKIGSGDFRIGYVHNAAASISGGDITVGGALRTAVIPVNGTSKYGTLNILGSESTWKVGALHFQSGGTVNLTAGALTEKADGTFAAPVSCINVTGNATVEGKITLDTTPYTYNGAAFINSIPTTLISAGGTLTWTPASIETKGVWKFAPNGNKLELSLDESLVAAANVASGSGVAEGVLGESGWVKISGNADSDYTLQLHYGGEGSGDDLALWLTNQLADANSGVSVKNLGEFIEFGNLHLDEDGLGFMSYNLAEFNVLNNSSLTFNNLPEPSAWALILTGMCFLFVGKKRFARRV